MRRLLGLVISKLAHHTVEGGTSCDWALQHNKVLNFTSCCSHGCSIRIGGVWLQTCVCVECGQEGTREAIESAKRVIMSFIVGHRLFGDKRYAHHTLHAPITGLRVWLTTTLSHSHCSRSRYVSTNQVRVRKGFRYARRVQAFEHVAYNEVPILSRSLWN